MYLYIRIGAAKTPRQGVGPYPILRLDLHVAGSLSPSPYLNSIQYPLDCNLSDSGPKDHGVDSTANRIDINSCTSEEFKPLMQLYLELGSRCPAAAGFTPNREVEPLAAKSLFSRASTEGGICLRHCLGLSVSVSHSGIWTS